MPFFLQIKREKRGVERMMVIKTAVTTLSNNCISGLGWRIAQPSLAEGSIVQMNQ